MCMLFLYDCGMHMQVAGLVGRADVLAGLFFTGSILMYMKAVGSERGQGMPGLIVMH